MAEEKKYYGTGRRKSSVARVYVKEGKGQILVNGIPVEQYMPYATLVQNLKQPLVLSGTEGKFDVEAEVNGGGFTG
jgi:small subunit ribosomal protein S9